MRLAIDAMGNDNGPEPIVQGVAAFLSRARHRDASVTLVGLRDRLEPLLGRHGLAEGGRLAVSPAGQVIEMHEKVEALRTKRDSSIVRLVTEVYENRADAMVALGNTAAAVGAATIGLRLLPGVRRPGIAVPMPTRKDKPCIVLDMGANTAAKPQHLAAYGVMASVYSQQVIGIPRPRVGLLNVGEERGKGNEVLREAFALLSGAPIDFVGNVEGGDVFQGELDVVVCDGFVGNVLLKAAEGLGTAIFGMLRETFFASVTGRVAVFFGKRHLRMFRRKLDYASYGGAPLLGVKGICIIGHGRSGPEAVENALGAAKEAVAHSLNECIGENLARMQTS